MCKQTIDRSKTVSSVGWLPSGQGKHVLQVSPTLLSFLTRIMSLLAIFSVEGSEVVKMVRSYRGIGGTVLIDMDLGSTRKGTHSPWPMNT